MFVMYYIPHATSQCNAMLENNICIIVYCIIFMSLIIRCRLILCLFFTFVIITFMEGIYYNLFNFFSFLFPNMYFSSCIIIMVIFKFVKLRVLLIQHIH